MGGRARGPLTLLGSAGDTTSIAPWHWTRQRAESPVPAALSVCVCVGGGGGGGDGDRGSSPWALRCPGSEKQDRATQGEQRGGGPTLGYSILKTPMNVRFWGWKPKETYLPDFLRSLQQPCESIRSCYAPHLTDGKARPWTLALPLPSCVTHSAVTCPRIPPLPVPNCDTFLPPHLSGLFLI